MIDEIKQLNEIKKIYNIWFFGNCTDKDFCRKVFYIFNGEEAKISLIDPDGDL